MRIILTGAQGTGKTTVLDHFRGRMPVITEVVRHLSKEGVKINELGDEEGQQKIFDAYTKMLSDKQGFISDRGLTDVYAYSRYHFEQGKLSLDELVYEAEKIGEMMKDKDILVCYFPIEFDVIDDGVRSINEDYRRYIDQTIKNALDKFGIEYVTVHGSVEERIAIIENAIKERQG